MKQTKMSYDLVLRTLPESIMTALLSLKAFPLEAILFIFGRRALIFLFESSWKNEK